MSLIGWIVWFVEECIKYWIVSYLLFHMDIRKGKVKYLLALYPIVGYCLVTFLDVREVYYRTLLGFFIIYFIFDGKLWGKIKRYLLGYALISVVDLFFWFSFHIFQLENDDLFSLVLDMIWLAVYLFLRKKRETVGSMAGNVTGRYYWLFFTGTAIVAVILFFTKEYLLRVISYNDLETMQGVLFRQVTYYQLINIYFFFVSGTMLFVGVLICLLIWNLYTRNELKRMNVIIENELFLQQKYYDGMLKKEQEKRAAMHEWNHHVQALRAFSKAGKTEELCAYIEKIDIFTGSESVVDTGNRLADYFISAAIEQLKSEGAIDFQVKGHFPAEIEIDDMDLSVLLANVLDNAREALQKVDGKKTLIFEICDYHQRLYITVHNTIRDQSVDITHTSKQNKSEHGYGIKNMRQVVEKYGGTLEYHVEEQDGEKRFVMEIGLL